MQVEVPRNALVIRFRPTRPDRVLASAAKEYRRTGYYQVSVFADVVASDEMPEVVQARLVQVAGLSGIDLAGQPKYFVCREAGLLLDRGFTFHKDDDDPDEAAEHYSVDLGEQPTVDDVNRFLGPFAPVVRRPS